MTSQGRVLRGTAELHIPVRNSTHSCVFDDLIIFTESEYDYAEGDYNYIYTDGIYDDYYEEEVYGELQYTYSSTCCAVFTRTPFLHEFAIRKA